MRCDPFTVSVLVSLAVGAVFTAVGALLAPKPPEQAEMRQKQLGNRNGRDRFAPVAGFDSVADIAAYGDPVPIVWTAYDDGAQSGGVVVEPKLVWSKMVSYGTQQGCRMLYVVGEAGVGTPSLAGTWLGNNGLNVIPDQEFYFAYGSSFPPPRVAGTKGDRLSGDPSQGNFEDFTQAYTPSNSTVFGVSNAVPNGTNYRVPWKVVSIPKDSGDDARRMARCERRKICGFPGDGMPGVGTGYPRRQGLVSSNTFKIYGTLLKKDLFKVNDAKADVEDINDELDNECAAADDILQLGEKFLVGGTLLQVSGRSRAIWTPRHEQTITFNTIEQLYPGGYGTVDERSINNDRFVAINKDGKNGGTNYGAGYYPLLKYTSAEFRTTRPCRIVEVGIRSEVWGRFNGMTNFGTVPYPRDLERMDAGNTTISTGTMSLYFQRTCGFIVRSRNAGDTSWITNHQVILVRGATPQAQYNGIMFELGSCRQVEIQFVPVAGAVIARLYANGVTSAPWMNSKSTSVISFGVGNGITASMFGEWTSTQNIGLTPLMTKAQDPFNVTTRYVPSGVKWLTFESTRRDDLVGLRHAWNYIVFGDAATANGTRQVVVTFDKKIGNRVITMAVLLEADPFYERLGTGDNRPTRRTWGEYRFVGVWDKHKDRWPSWEESYFDPTIEGPPDVASSASPLWRGGMKMRNEVRVELDNPFHNDSIAGSENIGKGYNVDFVIEITHVEQDLGGREERLFEETTCCTEVSHYGSSITRSCDGSPEHSIAYVNEILPGKRGNFGSLTLAAVSVKSSRSFTSMDQLRCWVGTGVNSSNSFPKLAAYMLQRTATSTNLNSSLVDWASFDSADAYCRANGLTFDGVIADRQNLRSFLADTAPYFLLNLVISNGKLALRPAMPSGGSVQLFTAGNIVDDSLRVEAIDVSQRRDFQAVVTYRRNPRNELPRLHTVRAYWNESAPMEQFDLSAFCTRHDHAAKVARYFMALRKYVTHTVSFKTYPDQVNLAPGDFISVAVQELVVQNRAIGVVQGNGKLATPVPVEDGTYDAVFYKEGMETVSEAKLTVKDGVAQSPETFGSLFALSAKSVTTTRCLVEQVELDQEGLVSITAVNFPDSISSTVFGGGGITVTPTSPITC